MKDFKNDLVEESELEKSEYEKLFEGYDLSKSRATFEWDEAVGKEIW